MNGPDNKNNGGNGEAMEEMGQGGQAGKEYKRWVYRQRYFSWGEQFLGGDTISLGDYICTYGALRSKNTGKIFACGADPLGVFRSMKVDTVSLFGCQVMHVKSKITIPRSLES